MTLSAMKPGQNGKITQVSGEGALRLRLLDMGVIPGTKVRLTKAAPLGDPIEIAIRGYSLTLRLEDAHLIQVEDMT